MSKIETPKGFSPSDLAAFLACPHLTTLELAVARGELEKPYRHQPRTPT